MKKYFKIIFYTSIVCGFVIGFIAVYIAFQHNPQGEFFNIQTGNINFKNSISLFLSGFIIVFGVCGLFSSLLALLIFFIKQRL